MSDNVIVHNNILTFRELNIEIYYMLYLLLSVMMLTLKSLIHMPENGFISKESQQHC